MATLSLLIDTELLGESLIRAMHSTLASEDVRTTLCPIHMEPVTEISAGFQSNLPQLVFPSHLIM